MDQGTWIGGAGSRVATWAAAWLVACAPAGSQDPAAPPSPPRDALGAGAASAASGAAVAGRPTSPADGTAPCRAALRWQPSPQLHHPRRWFAAVQLDDGRILVAGGAGRAGPTVELYDPQTSRWSEQAPMHVGRILATASRLADGRVFVTGGEEMPRPTSWGRRAARPEIFDPATGRWTLAAEQPIPLTYHAAAVLADGRVLVTGGDARPGQHDDETAAAWMYEPTQDRWQPAPPMSRPRQSHSATLLPDGRVIVIGGQDYVVKGDAVGGSEALSAVEIYDPKKNRWQPGPEMPFGRSAHTVTRLRDGQLLIVGGWSPDRGRTLLVDRFDPATGQWHEAGELRVGRMEHAATLLADGRVLVVGGESNGSLLRAFRDHVAESYDPATDRWSTPATHPQPRMEHGMFGLPDGRVLIFGGTANHYETPIAATELGTLDRGCAP